MLALGTPDYTWSPSLKAPGGRAEIIVVSTSSLNQQHWKGTCVQQIEEIGQRNSGATFQRMMDSIFGHLPHAIIYIDDLLIFSDTVDDHQQTTPMRGPDKCVFAAPSVQFLGHQISADGIRQLPSQIKEIQNYPVPTNVKELQAFLGKVNYYHCFIPMAADMI